MREIKISIVGTVIVFLGLLILIGVFIVIGVITSKNEEIKALNGKYNTKEINDSILINSYKDSIEGYKIHLGLKDKTINSQKLQIIHLNKSLFSSRLKIKELLKSKSNDSIQLLIFQERQLQYDDIIYNLEFIIDKQSKQIERFSN
jgi:hypothetical protein